MPSERIYITARLHRSQSLLRQHNPLINEDQTGRKCNTKYGIYSPTLRCSHIYCCCVKLHRWISVTSIGICAIGSFAQVSSWYSHERELKTDTEEKKLLNKVVIFVFFAHKNYSRSFIKLQLNHWCQLDYFNDGLEHGSCAAVYAGSEISRI